MAEATMSDTVRIVEVGPRDDLRRLEELDVATGAEMPKLVAATNDVNLPIGRPPVSRVASALNAKTKRNSYGRGSEAWRPFLALLVMVGTAQARLCPPFCNGPRLVNPFCVIRSPGSRFCTGSARGRRLMGLEEDRSTNLRFACSPRYLEGNGLT